MTANSLSGRSRRRLLFVLGTRPEAIKLGPVIRACDDYEDVDKFVCATGQHERLVEDALDLLRVYPDLNLKLMREEQTPSSFVQAALGPLTDVIRRQLPDVVIVQGDTASALAATLVATREGIPVAHVEAGVRTHDLSAPFPEESIRVVIDRLCCWRFAATVRARENLLAEQIPATAILVTGNTSMDALRMMRGVCAPDRALAALELTVAPSDRLIVVTLHRRETHGSQLESICRVLAQAAEERPASRFVFLVHPNPAVVRAASEISNGCRIQMRAAPRYDVFLGLLQAANLLLTDSGGAQEEACALGIPTLVLREKTDRPEAVEAGQTRVVGTDPVRIRSELDSVLDNPAALAEMAHPATVFGDGYAARRIIEHLRSVLARVS